MKITAPVALPSSAEISAHLIDNILDTLRCSPVFTTTASLGSGRVDFVPTVPGGVPYVVLRTFSDGTRELESTDLPMAVLFAVAAQDYPRRAVQQLKELSK